MPAQTCKNRLPALLALLALLSGAACGWLLFDRSAIWPFAKRPNFLFIITDDQSWAHTSYAGYPAVATPNFDRLAREGVYFENAYASAPTCTASRSAILTGRHFWQLGSAAQLWGEFPSSLLTYQQILEQHGYKVGYTGKGWGPGKASLGNPAGNDYNQFKQEVDSNLSTLDHVKNFRAFLEQLQPEQSFSFWISPTEPHRPYNTGIGLRSGKIDGNKILVPSFLPDVPEVRSDIADYLYEIEWFDAELGRVLQLLEASGQLDNTVIVYTSDNGMPFPRAKSNNYEYGTRVPLAVRWGRAITQPQQVADFISLIDIAPTFLELAGIAMPDNMSGKSFRQQLLAERSGLIDKQRQYAFSGFERHIGNARMDNHGYPSRALHSEHYLYIENLAPDRWPAGRPPYLADIDDGSPTKAVLAAQRETLASFRALAAAKRPARELYDLRKDPGQLHNLAADPEFAPLAAQLHKTLHAEMQRTDDPCASEACDQFDRYQYHGRAE